MNKQEPIPKNGRDFLETYWQGIDVDLPKPIILTVDQLVVILDNYGRRISTRPTPISDEEIYKLADEISQNHYKSEPNNEFDRVYKNKRTIALRKSIRDTFKQALSQGNPTLIKRLWSLWESLAESGELSADKTFIENYNELKKEV